MDLKLKVRGVDCICLVQERDETNFQFHKMWVTSELDQEILTSEEDLRYVVLVGWLF
jgi:hypothetical protein